MEGKEYRARIPDDDAANWITTLHECGFTSEEIDKIMTHLNDTYAEQKFGKGKIDLMAAVHEKILSEKGVVTYEMRARARQWIIDNLRREANGEPVEDFNFLYERTDDSVEQQL